MKPDQVQRVAGRDGDHLAVLRAAANGAQRLERLRRGELLADDAGHQPAAAQLAPHLQPAVDAHQVAPGRRLRLAPQQVAEHDPVAARRTGGPAPRCGPPRRAAAGVRSSDQRPGARTARRVLLAVQRPYQRRRAPGVPASPPGQQRPQRREAVGGHPAGRHQLPERVLDLGAQAAGAGDDVLEEAGPRGGEEGEHLAGPWRTDPRAAPRRIAAGPSSQRQRSRRRARAMGAARVGTWVPSGRHSSRPQTTSPPRHSSSSQPGS